IAAMALGDAIERELSDAHVSENLRHTMLQLSYDAIIVVDQTGSIVEFNPAAERMFGWSRAEILGRDMLHTIVPSFYRSGFSTGGEYMAMRGAPMVGNRMESVAQDRDGNVFPIEITVTEMAVGERQYYAGSIRDLRAQRDQ